MKNLIILLAVGALGFTLTGCGGVIVGDDSYGGPDLGMGFFDGGWGGGGWGHGHGGHGGGHGGHR